MSVEETAKWSFITLIISRMMFKMSVGLHGLCF